MKLNRRDMVFAAAATAAASASGLFVNEAAALTPLLQPTPRDSEGPFYPTEWTGEIDGDLITVNGKRYDAGASMLLLGRILDSNGTPIRDARVEIWQVDATGQYRHPRDDGDGPLKRGFQGFGRVASDEKGGYRFRTIKPVNYGGRPAHVHFRVEAKGYRSLTTQMYFAGENQERGGLGGFSRERDRLTVKTEALKDASAGAQLATNFEIVLAKA
jgi:protocatechuate 3,4-dioxygenase, beta subunit